MKILAIDTSCEQASCALYIEGEIVEKKSPVDKRRHSSSLMPMVSDLLAENSLTAGDMDFFAVGSGPGSFTGIRIGMSAVKGMAFAAGKSIHSAKSLDILANRYKAPVGIVCPMIDARNRQVYTALYKWNGDFYEPETDYIGISIEKLSEILAEKDGPIVICGDALEKYQEFLTAEAGIIGIESDSSNKYPSAAVLADMAARGIELIDKGSASATLPFYLRESQAKRLYDR
ncbi:MAG: tRNA (adenosine(37)-N6)-threonylcarbamoyltransferase complex dimerization subunit type 1 TsaB [Clostridia bacterium]|nr:tRNA (adenosine(37)-N6)-threonylcarbamoyltransferase complex dimerization subunit type 1 TsaB [Clostridia bacterium]MBN2882039.1 tRNA (adenosine(37)-N6)-threonylcarbamoyltransferase complex dimerization subunit type 1 TsaB [Clostridia bacterium]